MSEKKTIVIICGPTASGKTDLAVEMAKHINGEIVSADSMQIYKYMNIGTAKPTDDEKQGIKHYLIDFLEPSEDYNVRKFKDDAKKCIDKIINDNKVPIIVGGTGLYIDSIIYDNDFGEINIDLAYRNKLLSIAEEKGNEYIYNMLSNVDEKSSERIHINDTKRIIRALEIFNATGITQSEFIEKSRLKSSPYECVIVGVGYKDRDKLYERINKRVDIMIEKGLVEETKSLLKMNIPRNATSMQAIGYKEILEYIDGKETLHEATEKLKKATRNYAKRQITWFKRNSDITWFYVDEIGDRKKFIEKIQKHMEKYGIIWYNLPN